MKLYEIKEDKIIFYPKRQDFLALGIILSVCLYMIIIPVYLSMNEQGLHLGIIHISLTLLIPLIILILFIYLSKETQIIIDITERSVIRRNLLGNKKIALLENVNKVQLSDSGSMYVTTYIYELIFHDDIYGLGIRLTPTLRKKSKKLNEIYDNAIIKVEKLLSDNPFNTIPNKTIEQKIHFFNETNRDCYIYKEKSIVALIFTILPLLLFVYLTVYQNLDSYYHFIFLAISIIGFIGYGSQVKIDTYNQTIESSSYGLFKSKCHFSEIAEITPQKLFHNGAYSTTNIIIRTNRDKKPYQIQLASIKDTKKVALFINDLTFLLTPSK